MVLYQILMLSYIFNIKEKFEEKKSPELSRNQKREPKFLVYALKQPLNCWRNQKYIFNTVCTIQEMKVLRIMY